MSIVATVNRLRYTLWPIRVAWLVLPLVAGEGFAGLLTGRRAPVVIVGGALLWLAWGCGLVALLVAHPLGLTALRVIVPAGFVSALAGLLSDSRSGADVVAVLAMTLVGLGALSGSTADSLVDGASYGPERRFALRSPTALAVLVVPFASMVVLAGAVTGPLLLASQRWVPGVIACVVGFAAAWRAGLGLHSLSLRWLVFVPAGFVVHDRMTLADPVLMPRATIASVGPALADSAAVDLTGRAAGLLIEVRLRSSVPAARRDGRRACEQVELSEFLVAPLRPGAFLKASARAGLLRR